MAAGPITPELRVDLSHRLADSFNPVHQLGALVHGLWWVAYFITGGDITGIVKHPDSAESFPTEAKKADAAVSAEKGMIDKGIYDENIARGYGANPSSTSPGGEIPYGPSNPSFYFNFTIGDTQYYGINPISNVTYQQHADDWGLVGVLTLYGSEWYNW